MKKVLLAASVAVLAIAAPAAADPGGKGGGNKGQSASAERGGGQNARSARADRGRDARPAKANRSREARSERRRGGEKARGNARAENRARARADDGDRRQARRLRAERRGNERLARNNRDSDDRRLIRSARDRDVVRLRDRDEDRFEERFARRGFPSGFVKDCPPGLSVAPGVCMPPGQFKKLEGRRLPAGFQLRQVPTKLRDLYRDTDDSYYRYGNGYLYRMDRDSDKILSLLPLIGAGLGIGQASPFSSSRYDLPSQYRSFYPQTQDDYYRYANGYVYEVDRDTGLIEDMIPLLDQGYGVGQMLPASYSYYNVPYPYRNRYVDNDDYAYRYAPGAIYQVDQKTQLITAVASLLTGNRGLSVGQPLPMGFNAYNMPYQYRDRYSDTPDSWYRYSNGYVYQVDPTTRLITAIVDAVA